MTKVGVRWFADANFDMKRFVEIRKDYSLPPKLFTCEQFMKLCKLISLSQRGLSLDLVSKPQAEFIKWKDGTELSRTQSQLIMNLSTLNDKNLQQKAEFGKKDPKVIDEISDQGSDNQIPLQTQKFVQPVPVQPIPVQAPVNPKVFLEKHAINLQTSVVGTRTSMDDAHITIQNAAAAIAKSKVTAGQNQDSLEKLNQLYIESVQQADERTQHSETSFDDIAQRIKADHDTYEAIIQKIQTESIQDREKFNKIVNQNGQRIRQVQNENNDLCNKLNEKSTECDRLMDSITGLQQTLSETHSEKLNILNKLKQEESQKAKAFASAVEYVPTPKVSVKCMGDIEALTFLGLK